MNLEPIYEYTDSYIAFLDILGFKELIGKNTCSEIMEIFRNYKNPISTTSIGSSININHEEIKMKVMSDSISFSVATAKEYALVSIIAVCQVLAEKLLRLSTPILLRGAVVRGEIFQEGDIIFGPGLLEAIALEKATQDPRIVLSKSTVNDINQLIDRIKSEKDESVMCYIDSMLYKDQQKEVSIVCVDYMEVTEGLDTDGTFMPKLYKHTLDQIKQLKLKERKKWIYFKKQILRYYRPVPH